MIEKMDLATNSELKKRKEELNVEFEQTKLNVAKYMLLLEELEKEYLEVENILNKRLKK